jgi:hypothetical protein
MIVMKKILLTTLFLIFFVLGANAQKYVGTWQLDSVTVDKEVVLEKLIQIGLEKQNFVVEEELVEFIDKTQMLMNIYAQYVTYTISKDDYVLIEVYNPEKDKIEGDYHRWYKLRDEDGKRVKDTFVIQFKDSNTTIKYDKKRDKLIFIDSSAKDSFEILNLMFGNFELARKSFE